MSFVVVGAGAGYLLGGTALAVGAGAVAGAAVGGAFSGGGGGGNAPQVDPKQVGTDSLATQLQLAPQVYDANATYAPKYSKLNQQILSDSLLGTPTLDVKGFLASHPEYAAAWASDPSLKDTYGTLENFASTDYQNNTGAADPTGQFMSNQGGLVDLYGKVTPQLGAQQSAANTQQRTADIADVASLGGQARDAYLAANPDLVRSMAALDKSVTDAGTAAKPTLTSTYGGKSALQLQLEQQAAAGLAQNGQLSAEDLRNAQQAARGAAAARGIYDSNSSLTAEVLNTDAMTRQRRAEAQSLAAGVDAAGQQQTQFGAGLEAQRQLNQTQLDRTATNDQIGREMQLATMYQSQGTDPFQLVLGRSGAPAQTQGAVQQSSTTAQNGPTLFNPFDPSITSIYAGNAANQTAAQIAAANGKSAQNSALIGAAGTIGAAYLMCWVARAAYGTRGRRWLAARRWMVVAAPAALRELYAARGPILAQQLVTPTRRAQLRALFERLLHGDAGAIADLTAELNAA